MGINVTKLRHEPHYAVYLRKRTRRQRTRNSDNWLSAARRARLPRVTVIGGAGDLYVTSDRSPWRGALGMSVGNDRLPRHCRAVFSRRDGLS